MEIILSNYEELIKNQGESVKKAYLGEMVLKGKAKYYLIYQENKYVEDFWIYTKDDNHLCIVGLNTPESICLFDDETLMNELFEKLRSEFKTLTVELVAENKKRIDLAVKYDFKYVGFNEYIDSQNEKNIVNIYKKVL